MIEIQVSPKAKTNTRRYKREVLEIFVDAELIHSHEAVSVVRVGVRRWVTYLVETKILGR